jgi:hypothetical protein
LLGETEEKYGSEVGQEKTEDCSEIHQIEILIFAISFEMRAVFDGRPKQN